MAYLQDAGAYIKRTCAEYCAISCIYMIIHDLTNVDSLVIAVVWAVYKLGNTGHE